MREGRNVLVVDWRKQGLFAEEGKRSNELRVPLLQAESFRRG